MRKNKTVAIAGIFLFLFLTGLVHAQTSKGDAALVLKDISMPSKIYPGESFDLSFKIENTWESNVWEVYVYLEGGYPLLNTSPTEPYYIRTLGYIYWLSKTSDPLNFTLSVDDSAIAGLYTIDVVLTYRRYSETQGKAGAYERFREVIPILITVEGSPKLEVFVETSQPPKIRAGDTADLNLKVVNVGTDKAKNILLFPESIKLVDVLWFSKRVHVGDITPQNYENVEITLDVDENAEAKEYALPIGIIYETPDGERISTPSRINVTIEESADFVISPISNSANSGDRDERVIFNIKNSGTKLAEDVKVILRANYPFTPTGNEYFVGTLNPEESMDISFHVDVDSDASSGRYPVDMIIQWKEDDTEYTKTKSSFINVQRLKSNWQIYAAIPFGLVILIVILKKIRAKKSRK